MFALFFTFFFLPFFTFFFDKIETRDAILDYFSIIVLKYRITFFTPGTGRIWVDVCQFGSSFGYKNFFFFVGFRFIEINH